VHPHLVLHRIAAGGVVLHRGEQAQSGQPLGGLVHLVGGRDLDPEVVHDGGLIGLALDEHELELRWMST
jgi:hypothetical protein